jgi:hypothetical protein
VLQKKIANAEAFHQASLAYFEEAWGVLKNVTETKKNAWLESYNACKNISMCLQIAETRD